MTRRRVTAVGCIVMLAALSGCSGGGLSSSGRDACNMISSWSSEGVSTTERTTDVISVVKLVVEDAHEPQLQKSFAVLEDSAGDDRERADAADSFRQVCADLGWELPEG